MTPAEGLTLTVLGCSGSYAGPGQACSGYLLQSPATSVVLDLGPGTLANLQRHIDPAQLDAVVLSHEHPDHWGDLPVFRNALRYYLDREGLAVFGTAGTQAMATAVSKELSPTLDWTAIDETTAVQVGDLTFQFSPTDHPVPTFAMRIAQAAGPEIAYSADTGPGWLTTGAAFVAGVDLFLCEATVLAAAEDEHPPHLSARQAANLAEQAEVKQLVLTHAAPGVSVSEQLAEARPGFTGRLDAASSGATFTV